MSKPRTANMHSVQRWGQWLNDHLFSHLGFIIALARRPSPTMLDVNVGRFQLKIPGTNPLSGAYHENPTLNAQLGRLAKSVFEADPAAFMIDVGANVGDTAAVVRSVTEIPIVCIEGDPATFAQLNKNIAVMQKVESFQLFLGERTETVYALTEKDGWNTTILPTTDSEGSKRIDLISLDEFLSRPLPGARCKLLKIDAEGFDLRILRGATELLRCDQPVLTFEYNRANLHAIGDEALPIFAHLAALGYRDMLFYDPQGRLVLSGNASQSELIRDLHEYLEDDGLFYFDVTFFHQNDEERAAAFIKNEKSLRSSAQGA